MDERSDVRAEEAPKGPVVCDVLAYYVPYTHDRNKWGIYFVKETINRDFGRLSEYLSQTKNITGIEKGLALYLYVPLIFVHEFTHHVFEDMKLSKGKYKYDKSEERVCEYTALP